MDVRDFIDAMKESDKGPEAFDTQAEVLRIEDGTAWVHIPGGAEETPVRLTIAAAEGDTVQVRVSGGTAFMVGNASAPPTDDTTAIIAQEAAEEAHYAADKAGEAAETASKIAGNTNQYFWHTETGTDTGAHITEIPQKEFIEDPENGGGNLLARSNGIAVRKGLTELSTFSASGIQIGRSSESHLEMDFHSFQLVDKEGDAYLHISDLRGSDGYADIEEIKQSDGSTTVFEVQFEVSSPVTAYLDLSGRVLVEGTDYTRAGKVFTLATAPADDDDLIIDYRTSDQTAKAYTFGQRANYSAVGGLSVAEGMDIGAEGYCSHAEGYMSVASGKYSHAEGDGTRTSGRAAHAEGFSAVADGDYSHAHGYGTIATQEAQTAIGKYNADMPSGCLLTIGNGSSSLARSNAMAVQNDGEMYVALNENSSSGTVDGDIYGALQALGWTGILV